MEVESILEYPQNIPRQVCVLLAENSASSAMRRHIEFPCKVTMSDGVRQLTITAEMAEKSDKAINECTMIPPTSSLEELLTFNYFNWQETMRLKNDRAILEERKKQANASSARRRALSMSSTVNLSRKHQSRLSHLPEDQVEALTRNLGTSYYTYDEAGIPVPKTATGAIYTAAAYLQATKPLADDPNAQLHRQHIKSLALAAKASNQGR